MIENRNRMSGNPGATLDAIVRRHNSRAFAISVAAALVLLVILFSALLTQRTRIASAKIEEWLRLNTATVEDSLYLGSFAAIDKRLELLTSRALSDWDVHALVQNAAGVQVAGTQQGDGALIAAPRSQPVRALFARTISRDLRFAGEQIGRLEITIQPTTSGVLTTFAPWAMALALLIGLSVALMQSFVALLRRRVSRPVEMLAGHLAAAESTDRLAGLDLNEAPEEIIQLRDRFVTLGQNLRDLTQRREQRKADEQLKLQAIRVAHDIRSPLNVLQYALSEDRVRSGTWRSDIVRHCIDRINGIAGDLLDTHRGTLDRKSESAAPSAMNGDQNNSAANIEQKTDIRVVLQNIAAEKRLEHKDLDIRLSDLNESDTLVTSGISSAEVSRIVSNVVNNAVAAALRVDRRPSLTIHLRTKDSYVQIQFMDNGSGVADVDVEKIFAGQAINGNGVGLATARTYLALVGGYIQLIASAETGSVFELGLPIDATNSTDERALDTQSSGADVHAVLVDDDVWTCDAWQSAAAAAGVKLRVFASAESLLDELTTIDPGTEIFVDRFLGNADGVSLARALDSLGYRNLKLTTSAPSDDVAGLPFLREIIDKTPRFEQSKKRTRRT